MYVSSRGELGAIIPAVAAIIGTAASAAPLFSGKVHLSPWGFLYDEYPRKIYELEKVIRSATGEPMPPDPDPGNPKPKGGPAYQTAMLNIIPRYVPGSESQIAAYDRRGNEPGGFNELTVQLQLEKIAAMQGQQAPAMPPQSPQAAKPASPQVQYSVSRTSGVPSIIPSVQVTPAQYLTPAQQRQAQRQQIMQAGMFPDLGQYGPMILIGGAALVLILSLQSAPKGKGR